MRFRWPLMWVSTHEAMVRRHETERNRLKAERDISTMAARNILEELRKAGEILDRVREWEVGEWR